MLEVKSLTKQYPTAQGPLSILSDVSFGLRAGDAASIMGPSGSGKSTLLYILGALEPPTQGSVSLDGTDPFTLGERDLAAFRNTRVGFVFQDHLLLPQCTVLENVLIPTLVGPSSGAVEAHAVHLLEQVGLKPRLDHRPSELSGGERQRVALARALVQRPPLVLCDEPTGNLDRASAENVAEMLFALHRSQESILVIVTHNAELGARCPIRYRLDGQRLARAGDADAGTIR